MNISNVTYQRTAQELAFIYSNNLDNQFSFKASNLSNPIKFPSDTIELSKDVKEINDLGLNLIYSNTVKENSSINFEYNFSNEFIQVQSKGKFDLAKNTGKIDIIFDFSKIANNPSEKISVLPKEVKITLDFSLFEKEIKKDDEKNLKPPDFLTIAMKIIKNLSEAFKNESDKDQKLSQTNQQTFQNFIDNLDKEKISDKMLEWLYNISKIRNPNSKAGDKDNSLFATDKEIDIQIEKKNFSLKINNIQVESNTPNEIKSA
jgi:hypothetical protein